MLCSNFYSFNFTGKILKLKYWSCFVLSYLRSILTVYDVEKSYKVRGGLEIVLVVRRSQLGSVIEDELTSHFSLQLSSNLVFYRY